MPKTGWKFTKQMPNKSTTNQIKRSNASSVPGRVAPKGKGADKNMRTQDTINRLKMYVLREERIDEYCLCAPLCCLIAFHEEQRRYCLVAFASLRAFVASLS